MKIKCQVCGNIGYLQHIGKNYYRIRHYVSSVDGKPKFEYHQQSLEYISQIESIDLSGQDNIDPKLLNNGFIIESRSRGSLAWPGRQTHNLENKMGQTPMVQKSRARIPPPAPFHQLELDSKLVQIKKFNLALSMSGQSAHAMMKNSLI